MVETGTDERMVAEHLSAFLGGMHEPLSHEAVVRKFFSNAAYGGWSKDRAQALLAFCEGLRKAPDLAAPAALRH